MSVVEFVQSYRDETTDHAIWFALGYATAAQVVITTEQAREFGEHYADLYEAWYAAGNPSSTYPAHGAVMRKWLAKQ